MRNCSICDGVNSCQLRTTPRYTLLGHTCAFCRITGYPEVIPSQKAHCAKSQPFRPLACVVAKPEKSVKTTESFQVSFPKYANLPLGFPSSRSIARAPARHRTFCRFQK